MEKWGRTLSLSFFKKKSSMVLYGTKDPKAFDRGGTCLEFLPSLSMKLHCWSKEKLSFVFFFQVDCGLCRSRTHGTVQFLVRFGEDQSEVTCM